MSAINIPMVNQSGQSVGSYEFDTDELAGSVNKQLLHDVVVMYESNKRVGTAKTKGRGEVAGSTKKMYKQKGTGRARMGNKRTGKRRGGGHTFAKVPRDWGYRLPRRAIQLATRMALRSKFDDGQVVLVDELSLPAPKTKNVFGILKALGLDSVSTLVTLENHDGLFWRSARNIPTVRVSPATELNAYELLHQRRLLLTKGALDKLRGIS